MSQPAALVVTAHGKGRPVLPKPPSERSSPQRQQPQGHSPSSPSPSPVKTHGHGHMYSPYGRAYEYQYGGEAIPDMTTQRSFSLPLSPSHTSPQDIYDDQNQSNDTNFAWLAEYVSRSQTGEMVPLSFCGCGANCTCMGCAEHQSNNDANGSKGCHDPASCMACLDCMTIPIAPEIRFESIPDSTTMEAVDNWLREVSSSLQSPSVPAYSPNSYSPIPPSSSQENVQFDSALYALWANSETSSDNSHNQPPTQFESPTTISTNTSPIDAQCTGRCLCPTGMCTCGADSCGCCQGCQCVACAHEDPNRLLTFAISGERGVCCADRHAHAHMSGNNNNINNIDNVPSSSSSTYVAMHTTHASNGAGLGMGDVELLSGTAYQPFDRRSNLSRASSFSSHSSGHFSRSSSSLVSDADPSHGTGEVHPGVSSCCSGLRTTNLS